MVTGSTSSPQIRIAQESLSPPAEDLVQRGHAIECRVYAEA
jgi:acetyl/propionyl-CoA carboxylase alpha subunit